MLLLRCSALWCGLASCGSIRLSSAPPPPWNMSAVCSERYNFTATSWDNLCGPPGDGLAPDGTRCKNFSNIVTSFIVGDDHFGDNATASVHALIHGPARCGSEAAPVGTCPAGTSALPEGLRSIRFSGVDRDAILASDEDNILPGWNASNKSWAADAPCQPSIVSQEKGPWPGIWLDHAAWRLGNQSAKFFAAYKAAGGELDEIVLDTEVGPFLTWGVADNFDHTKPGAEQCALARWTAIQNDSRFPPVLAELLKRGLVVGDQTDPHYLAKAMAFHKVETKAQPLTNRNVWNALAFEREVEFWETAIFKAAKENFPHVRGSDWLYTKWSSDYCIPDPESNMGCRTPGHSGAVPGGDGNGFSTTMMYDNFNEAGNWAQDSIAYVLQEFFGVPSYPKTAFNVIRLSMYQGRAMVVGGRAGAGPEVPAKPWMGFQNYGWVWHDNDFYQELWHQLAAGGVSQFYYFAPWIFGVTMREHELVSDMLSEMTALLGCADRSWITDTNIRWQDDFLLSGSTVGTGNLTQRVWRFTPLDPTSFAPVVSAKLSPREAGNVTIPVTMEMSGKQRACELSFVQAVLRFGRSSHYVQLSHVLKRANAGEEMPWRDDSLQIMAEHLGGCALGQYLEEMKALEKREAAQAQAEVEAPARR